MSITLLIYWILIKYILVVDSAPKFELRSLRNDIYDPLIESSDSYLSYEMAIPKLRGGIPAPEVAKLQYEGYIFDENICKEINNRILCGYDKNKGQLFNQYEIVDMGNGCRTRGDRIECGYVNGQYYKHLRRPIQNDEHDEEHEVENHDKLARQAPTRTGQPPTKTDEQTTSNIYYDTKFDTVQNSAISKLFKISSDVQSKQTTPSTTFFEPVILSSTALPETLTTVTTVNEVPTITTTGSDSTHIPENTQFESTQLPEITQFESTLSEPTSTLLTTETTSTSTSGSSELEDTSSDSEAMKRIVKIRNNNDEEKSSTPNDRRLSDVLTTLVELNTESNTIVSTIAPPFVSNCGTTSNTGLRMKTSSGEIISTACVEKDDRVVCYDFKTQ